LTRKRKKLIIITGLSGSGKTYTLHTLEDIGYYCIDNLPVDLVSTFLNLIDRTKAGINAIAIICDIREKRFLDNFQKTYENLKSRNLDMTLVFLEANNEVLLRRFSETRRPHPLGDETTLSSMIEKERKMLSPIRDIADQVIDTSDFNVHQLKSYIASIFAEGGEGAARFTINIISFGYKHGLPLDADIIMDVRFLPNPYFEKELKEKSGLDAKVADYVKSTEEYNEFFPRMKDMLEHLIPKYKREGKFYLNVAFGCTGGRHRSVVVGEEMLNFLTTKQYNTYISHRDINISA